MINIDQWPFQRFKLEVPTIIYQAYFLGVNFGGVCPQVLWFYITYMYGTVPQYLPMDMAHPLGPKWSSTYSLLSLRGQRKWVWQLVTRRGYRLLWERSPRPLEGHRTIAWYNLPEGSELVLDPVDFQEQGMVWWMGRQRELYMPMTEQVPNESSVTEAGGSEGRKESDIDTWTSDNTETSFQSFQWLMCCNV